MRPSSSMYMHACTHTCTHAHTHAQMCTHTNTRMHACMHALTACACTHTHTHTHTHKHTHTQTHTHTRTQAHTHTNTDTCMHTHTHTHTQQQQQQHTHTHTHTLVRSCPSHWQQNLHLHILYYRFSFLPHKHSLPYSTQYCYHPHGSQLLQMVIASFTQKLQAWGRRAQLPVPALCPGFSLDCFLKCYTACFCCCMRRKGGVFSFL